MLWDVFCRVIDNYGDIGVCWRLAADLASRGESVRLWVDDASALAWMAPPGREGVRVRAWDDAGSASGAECGDMSGDISGDISGDVSGDVVIEAFGCDPPSRFVEAIARRRPVWINLEYLSAEPYVERSHGLASPVQHGPARGLVKWFYYPGFTPATGGLLREEGLLAARDAFDRDAWLASRGLERSPGEQVVNLFCYSTAPIEALIERLATEPTLLLATPGPAASRVAHVLGPSMRHGGLRAVALGALPQTEFDRLLWAGDLNLVRGEDSLVRALWAGRPLVWQAYAQDDGAHAAKVDACLDCFFGPAGKSTATAEVPPPNAEVPPANDEVPPGIAQVPPARADVPPAAESSLSADVRALWHAWNGLGRWPSRWPDPSAWREAASRGCTQQAKRPDLTCQLQAFVDGKR